MINNNKKYSRSRLRQLGVSMVESLISFPLLIIFGLGTVQMGYIWEAKNTMNYAALMAARAGATSGLDYNRMKLAGLNGLRPILSSLDLASYNIIADLDVVGANLGMALQNMQVDILVANPTLESFTDFNDPVVPCDGIECIPNSELDFRGIPVGAETLNDANLLRIELFYNYPTTLPIVGTIIAAIASDTCADDSVFVTSGCTPESPERVPRITIRGVATVRMQSVAQHDQNNTSIIYSRACRDLRVAGAATGTNGCPDVVYDRVVR